MRNSGILRPEVNSVKEPENNRVEKHILKDGYQDQVIHYGEPAKIYLCVFYRFPGTRRNIVFTMRSRIESYKWSLREPN